MCVYVYVYIYNAKLNSIRDKQYATPIPCIISLNSDGYRVLVLFSPPFYSHVIDEAQRSSVISPEIHS